MEKPLIRPARIADVKKIKSLVDEGAALGQLLSLSLSELYSSIRDFLVIEKGGQPIAACSLRVCWEDLAEIRSLTVDQNFRGLGYAKILLRSLLESARALGVERVFALTYIPQFFFNLGFTEVDKAELPHKVWKDCLKCPKFPECNETAVIYHLGRSEK